MATAFIPDWTETPPEPGTFRSIFKWGAPDRFKHPNDRLFALLRETFHLDNTHFNARIETGDVLVGDVPEPKIPEERIAQLRKIAGDANVSVAAYDRIRYASGKTTEEAMELRKGILASIADVIVHPRNREDVKSVVAFCNAKGLPVSVYGGGSSVTLGHRMPEGGVVLAMGTHMNRILEFNEEDQSVTVEPGIMGPAFEDALNRAPERFRAKRGYTCGHFPQSFEFSSVGGWVVTLGSGQASSYYGDAADLLLGVEVVTPTGELVTRTYPATATGPKIADLIKGSEGAFGILTAVTLKIFRKMPENRQRYAFIFPDWESAVNASREISQAEFGMPAVFRISDPEETEIGLKLYGVEGTPIDSWMKLRGYRNMKRCIALGTAEGEKGFSRNVARNVKRIARRHGAMNITGYPVKKWEHSRYMDPYMREDLGDFGIIIDTLETSVRWSDLHRVHQAVRSFIKARPQTVCMTHASHFYAQGTNLYFIFIARMETLEEYRQFHRAILDEIEKAGGSLSHHHGVGRMMAPLMERHLGRLEIDLLRTVKRFLDPNGILEPGVLGL